MAAAQTQAMLQQAAYKKSEEASRRKYEAERDAADLAKVNASQLRPTI